MIFNEMLSFQVDKTVEKIKHACQTTSKKLYSCMQNKEGDNEKSRGKVSQNLLIYNFDSLK